MCYPAVHSVADGVEEITSLEGHLIGTSLTRGTEKKECLTGKSSNVIIFLLFHLPPFGFPVSLKKRKITYTIFE